MIENVLKDMIKVLPVSVKTHSSSDWVARAWESIRLPEGYEKPGLVHSTAFPVI